VRLNLNCTAALQPFVAALALGLPFTTAALTVSTNRTFTAAPGGAPAIEPTADPFRS
jgi:hypothetical protein